MLEQAAIKKITITLQDPDKSLPWHLTVIASFQLLDKDGDVHATGEHSIWSERTRKLVAEIREAMDEDLNAALFDRSTAAMGKVVDKDTALVRLRKEE